ncbi:MAG TPA: hypothetical protein VIJ16_00310 [Gemmatimonadaceae bacterium]
MRIRNVVVLVAGLALAQPQRLPAQTDAHRDGPEQDSVPAGRRGGRGMADRAHLQAQIRQAFTHAVRTQVGLTDDQMQKLAPINQKFQAQRQRLAREERGVRMSLREELGKSQPDQDKVAQLSNQLQAFPRQRLDINDAEDKELSGLMTPVQLARYRALQERIQRQMNSMRGPRSDMMPPSDSGMPRRRGGGGSGGGGGGL